jgi:hypothetical protein
MNLIFKYLLISITLQWLTLTSVSAGPGPVITDAGTGSDNNLSKERIYIQTDREIYIAGENLFFKIYLYDEGHKKLSLNSKFAYILICSSGNKQIAQLCLPLSGGTGYGCLALRDTLKTGTYRIIACTNWMRNFGESGFFQKQIFIANRFDEQLASATTISNENDIMHKPETDSCLTISTDREYYHQREKVTLNLSLLVNSSANVSVSVAEKPAEKFYNANMVDALNFYEQSAARTTSNGRDNLKMCDYLPEDKGYIITGFVQHPTNRAGILVKLSTPDTLDNLMYSTTNSSGRFFFQLNDFYYNKELYISIANQKTETESDLILENKFAFDHVFKPSDTLISNQSVLFIKKCQTIANINNAYKIQPVKNEAGPAIRTLYRAVSCKPDYKVFLSDYVPFKDFNEIVKETLPYVRLRKNESNYEAEILDQENKIFMKNPGVFLNGMLINNINNIISFGSDKIRRIETVCHTRVFGSMVFNGILSIFTSPEVNNNIFFDKHSLHLPPITLLEHSQYAIPDYSAPEKRISRTPDFRQLLYWNPSLDITAKQNIPVGFYTSDSKGIYIIKVEGISSDGKPISSIAYFNVR